MSLNVTLSPEVCLTCFNTFPTIYDRIVHGKSNGHAKTTVAFLCMPCGARFSSSVALLSHTQSTAHDIGDSTTLNRDTSLDGPVEYTAYCQPCNFWFETPVALDDHLRNEQYHNWCFECSKNFRAPNDLANHTRSVFHRERDQVCPFCESKFKSASGVAHHIESGCHQITRHQVTAAIHAMDIVPSIAIKQITAGPPPSFETSTTLIATEDSFDGIAYTCPILNCSKSAFATLRALNLHLNSPAHDKDVFKCHKCSRQFKVISGFVQHLESGSCGAAKLTEVDDYFNNLTGQFTGLLKA